jgi:periplasmic protein TonB
VPAAYANLTSPKMLQRPAIAPNLPDSGTSPRKVSWRLGVWLSPLPPISALVVSAIVHAGASGALLTLGYSVDMPVAEPETAAIAVEIIPETTPQAETPTQIQKGEPDTIFTEEPVVDEPVEEAPPSVPVEVAALQSEVELPDAVPMPVQRPKVPPQAKNDKASEKPKKAPPKGIEREPVPDIALSDKASEIRTAQMSGQYASLGSSETRNVRAEQRWLGQLAAHLERRKRYPQAAQSRRLEGTVRVRFLVLPDGTVTATQLVSSSGIVELDEEVLNLLDRASPLPKPPPDVNPLITVPVNFSIRR